MGQVYYLLGDIEKEAEDKILKLYSSKELEADILKVAHHRFKKLNNRKVLESSKSQNSTNRSRGKQ